MENYLTFRIARQDFAMRAERVRGLLPAHELITLEPHSPDSWICGVASVKGRDFPVIDLRGKFGIALGSQGREPLIVAVEVVSITGMQRMLGFVADRVSRSAAAAPARFSQRIRQDLGTLTARAGSGFDSDGAGLVELDDVAGEVMWRRLSSLLSRESSRLFACFDLKKSQPRRPQNAIST